MTRRSALGSENNRSSLDRGYATKVRIDRLINCRLPNKVPTVLILERRATLTNLHSKKVDGQIPELASIIDEIGRGAADRETRRELPFAEVESLRQAGFTAMTVPSEFGGGGQDIESLIRALMELSVADPNLTQIFRAHFVFIERLVVDSKHPWRSRWLSRAGEGAIFGNASQERSGATVGSHKTTARRQGNHWLVNGVKYYSTGSLFADWLSVIAQDDTGQIMQLLVKSDAPGVERIDDWDGFGQRLTGSGTTRFTDVAVDPSEVYVRSGFDAPSYGTPFAQLVLLAALAGILKRASLDAADFARSRTRAYTHASGARPSLDPLVQQVVGSIASRAFVAEAAVLLAARELQRCRCAVPDMDALQAAEFAVARAQVCLVPFVTQGLSDVFEVGGASATSVSRALDRHWRNARTIASHNPLIYQARAVGDYLINGNGLVHSWTTGEQKI